MVWKMFCVFAMLLGLSAGGAFADKVTASEKAAAAKLNAQTKLQDAEKAWEDAPNKSGTKSDKKAYNKAFKDVKNARKAVKVAGKRAERSAEALKQTVDKSSIPIDPKKGTFIATTNEMRLISNAHSSAAKAEKKPTLFNKAKARASYIKAKSAVKKVNGAPSPRRNSVRLK